MVRFEQRSCDQNRSGWSGPGRGVSWEVVGLWWYDAEKVAGWVAHNPPSGHPFHAGSAKALEAIDFSVDIVGLDVDVEPWTSFAHALHEDVQTAYTAEFQIRAFVIRLGTAAKRFCLEVRADSVRFGWHVDADSGESTAVHHSIPRNSFTSDNDHAPHLGRTPTPSRCPPFLRFLLAYKRAESGGERPAGVRPAAVADLRACQP